jgi:ligand-binding SRPBCC domain-containing protein
MMRILLKSRVQGNFKDVMSAFDIDLFTALKPKGAKMEIVEFTGSKKGDRVHLRFLWPVKTDWISHISEDRIDNDIAYFIDEGVKLPPGLSEWKHKHIVQKDTETTSFIIDDIYYRGTNKLLTLLLYPALYLGFYPRKKIYRTYFAKLFQSNEDNR